MKEIINNKVQTLLTKEFYCKFQELEEDRIVYSIHPKAKHPYIKIMAYKNCVVVCTSKGLSANIKSLLRGKSRDEIFELPLVYGQTIHYVPDIYHNGEISISTDYEIEVLLGKEILSLKGIEGFENSLMFDENGYTETKAVCVVRDHNKVIGMSGAAVSSVEGLWEVGIDVLPEYRNCRIGTQLVKKLTDVLLEKNIVPFYSASVTNIGSQMVASRCGYIPAWVDTFGTILDGTSVYQDMLCGLDKKYDMMP